MLLFCFFQSSCSYFHHRKSFFSSSFLFLLMQCIVSSWILYPSSLTALLFFVGREFSECLSSFFYFFLKLPGCVPSAFLINLISCDIFYQLFEAQNHLLSSVLALLKQLAVINFRIKTHKKTFLTVSLVAHLHSFAFYDLYI